MVTISKDFQHQHSKAITNVRRIYSYTHTACTHAHTNTNLPQPHCHIPKTSYTPHIHPQANVGSECVGIHVHRLRSQTSGSETYGHNNYLLPQKLFTTLLKNFS